MTPRLRAGTAASTHPDPATAVREAWSALVREVPSPSIVLVEATVGYDLARLHAALREVAGAIPFIGGTSCQGVMTDRGYFGAGAPALALLAFQDPQGAFGVGSAPLNPDPRAAAQAALGSALAAAGCEGQLPSAVWMVTSPGGEEAVVQGITDVVGSEPPLVGGSAADDGIAGLWRQLAPEGVLVDHVCVSVWFTRGTITTAFHSGYDATAQTGVVTSASGRLIHEIDGKPAAHVYDGWSGGAITPALTGTAQEVLGLTTLSPIGRLVGEVRGVPYYLLSHPSHVTASGALQLFTDFATGETVTCMAGSVDNLVARAGNTVRAALRKAQARPGHVRAALIVFCGGCLLAVRDRIDEVYENIRQELRDVPFLTAFTFGEQGNLADTGNRHGNLMISTLVITEESG